MKTKYFVNEAAKVVVCKITIDHEYFDDVSYVGVAKCNPVDPFDEKVGKRLANLRAHVKYHQALKKQYVKFAQSIQKSLDQHQAFIEHSNTAIGRLKKQIKETSNNY